MAKKKEYRVFISSAEPSADEHCAALINALKKTGGEFEFTGFGGEKMRQAGCNLIANTANRAVMAASAFREAARFIGLINKAKKEFRQHQPDLVIVCDSPSFNFHIAKAAKKAGCKVLFFVAPQLWAWGAWRLRKLRRLCDRLCCVLPFEQEWFANRGIDTTFVGNPLLDEAGGDLSPDIKRYEGYKAENAKVLILPGSRQAEIESLWPEMQQIAVRLKQKYTGMSFNVVAVDEEKLAMLKKNQLGGFDCQYSTGSVIAAARNADFAIAASGSVTLQIAAAGCPEIIMYQSSKLLWHIAGKFIIKTKYLSLVNILAESELVPEFMPYFDSIDPIVESADKLLTDKNKLATLSSELVRLAEPMAGQSAAKVADIVIEMLGK
jgi:lipid-A-disaccharide synthase